MYPDCIFSSDDNLSHNTKTEKFSQRKIPTETEEKRSEKCWEQYLTMKLPTTKSQKESNSKVKQTSTTFPSVNAHSSEDCQPKPNSSFLWNKANRAQPVSSPAEGEEEEEEELYDDVKNCHTYSDISCYDDIQNVLTNREPSEECEPVYVSTDNLSVNYDDITNITSKTMQTEKSPPPTLVTATPAVILEDQCDSLSILYDDIRRDVGDDVTLYESIAGSLLRLDKLQVSQKIVNFMRFITVSSLPISSELVIF